MQRPVDEPAPKRPRYFWWLLANALTLCFAVISWAVCLHVFGNPEVPRNYEILRKLGRIPELRRFTVLNVPNGNVLGPKGLYSRFFPLAGDALRRSNAQLLRAYLSNYGPTQALTYIEGDYRVEQVRVLEPNDLISRGFAVRARAMIKPDEFSKPAPYPVLIEYIFPTEEAAVAANFRSGDILNVRKSPNCAALLHSSKVTVEGEEMLCLTVVPIAYGPYRIGESLSFAVEPPSVVHPGAKLPIFQQ